MKKRRSSDKENDDEMLDGEGSEAEEGGSKNMLGDEGDEERLEQEFSESRHIFFARRQRVDFRVYDRVRIDMVPVMIGRARDIGVVCVWG